MSITLDPKLEAILTELARERGVTAEEMALSALRERFLSTPVTTPCDEWERRLLALARNCGVSLSDAALSREELYE